MRCAGWGGLSACLLNCLLESRVLVLVSLPLPAVVTKVYLRVG